jgi:hypothetical protein
MAQRSVAPFPIMILRLAVFESQPAAFEKDDVTVKMQTYPLKGMLGPSPLGLPMVLT